MEWSLCFWRRGEVRWFLSFQFFSDCCQDAHGEAFSGNTSGWAAKLGELTDYLDRDAA